MNVHLNEQGSRWDLGPMFTPSARTGPMIPSYYDTPITPGGWNTAAGYFAAGSGATTPTGTVLADSSPAWGMVGGGQLDGVNRRSANPFTAGGRGAGAGYPWSSSPYAPQSRSYRGPGAGVAAGASFGLLNLLGLGIALWFGAKLARRK